MEVFGITINPIEGSWIKTVRYYNDIIWLTYSNSGMIPLLILTFYRYIRPIKDLQSYEGKANFKKQPGYYFEKALTFYAFYYYILDLLLTFIEGSYFETCRFAFLSHHVASLPLIYYTNKLNYMPWWTVAIASFHALLLAFPHQQLFNYPYLALIFVFHYMHGFQKPFCTMEIFKGIKKFYPAVYVALVIIWWTDCKNILPLL